jgi:hypothetical protein
MNSNLFILRQVNLWGDYGDVLVSGYISRDAATGQLLLHRGGPFAPPVFFPWSSICGRAFVVTGPFRQELERAPLGPLSFQPAVKDRIVHLPFGWQSWNRKADTPRERPSGGEPEAYIWDQPHSPAVAAEMPEFWEVLPPVLPCTIEREESHSLDVPDRRYFISKGAEYRGLFRDREAWFDLIVDLPTRQWLEQRVGEWVSFEPLIER